VLIGGGESEYFIGPELHVVRMECKTVLAAPMFRYHTVLKSFLCCCIPFLSPVTLSYLTWVFSVSSFPLSFFNCLCAVLRCPVNIYPKDAVVIEAQKKGKFGSYAALLCLLLASETVR
jgi:hypothetical protein